MNRLTIIGNVCKEPEVRSTPNGATVCSFNVAVNDRRKKDKEDSAQFFRVSAWNALGENCGKYLHKGSKVAVVGSVSLHQYKRQDGQNGASMEVTASEVEFLSTKSESTAEENTPSFGDTAQSSFTDVSADVEDSLPF